MILYDSHVSGSLTVSSSVTVGGTLTAQTIVAQTITSSIEFITGSTRNGSLLANTHQFTGSLFQTGSTAAFMGDVGIGTASPASKLDIVGDIGYLAQSAIYPRQKSVADWYLGKWDGGLNIDNAIGTSNDNAFRIGYYGGGTFAPNVKLSAGGGNISYINSGNVGIGLTAPTAKLHVSGTTGGVFEVDGAAAINALYVSASGNVGIGTTAPNTKLSIVPTWTTSTYTAFISSQIDATTLNQIGTFVESTATAATSMTFYTFVGNGTSTEKMRITSAGNLGLGVTPSAWDSNFKAIETTAGSIYDFQTTAKGISQNAYYSATGWLYKSTNLASQYSQNLGVHAWFNAPSGTAGTAISFTQAMTLDASGNLMVGTTSPLTTGGTAKISIVASSNVLSIGLSNSDMSYIRRISLGAFQWQTNNGGNNGEIHLQPYGGNVLIGTTTDGGYKLTVAGVINTTNTTGYLLRDNDVSGYGIYKGSSTRIGIAANGNEYLSVLSTGNVGIGTTEPSASLQVNKSSQTYSSTIPSGATIISNLAGGNGILEMGVDTTYLSYIQSRNKLNTTPYNLLLNPLGGNVGIGTATPTGSNTSNLLHVAGGSAVLRVGPHFSVGGDRDFIELIAHGSDTKVTSPNERFYFENTAGDIIISATGRVGVNTTTPVSGTLHVNGNVFATSFTGSFSGSYAGSIATASHALTLAGGTTNYVPLWSANTTVGSSVMYQSSSRIGINTLSPATTLAMAGSTATVFGFSLEPSGWNTAKHRLTVPTSGDTSMWSFNYNGSAVDTSSYAPSAITVGQGLITFSTTGSGNVPAERMRINGSGNVGIGTTSPSVALHTVGDGLFFSTTNTNLTINSNGGAALLTLTNTAGSQIIYGGVGGTNNMDFHTNSTFRARIDSSGNLGIGAITPAARLHVSGTEARFGGVASAYISVYNATGRSGYIQANGGTDLRIASDTDSMTFYVGSERMRIDTSGNVGIGTTIPNAKLAVNGNLSITGSGTFTSAINAGADLTLTGGTTFNYQPTIRLNSVASAGGVNVRNYAILSNYIVYGDFGIAQSNVRDGNAVTTGSTRFYVDNVGNVGIGTTAPLNKLHISGSTGIRVSDETGANFRGITFGATTADATEYSYIKWQPSSGEFKLYANTAGFGGFMSFYSNNAEAMRITSAGSVGIGTTAPVSKLEVYSGSGNNYIYTTNATSNTFNGLMIRYNSTDYMGVIGNPSTGEFRLGGFNNTGYFVTMYANNAEAVRINTSGNVGIGTTVPTARLHVSGTTGGVFEVDGSATAQNALYVSASGNVGIGTAVPSTPSGRTGLIIRPTNSQTTSEIVVQSNNNTDGGFVGLAISNIFNDGAAIYQRSGSHLRFGTSDLERMRITETGNVGIGMIGASYKLDVSGSTRISGSLAVGNILPSATVGRIDAANDVVAYSTSDARFKTNIFPISSSLEKIQQIRGVEFDWISDIKHGYEGHDVGVIAQELEKVLPEVVTTRDNGYKAVKYEKIVPLLIEAIKEQQKQIDELRAKLS
jgi:trimeric autotransporter adhesin